VRRKKTPEEVTAVRQEAARKRWASTTHEQRVAATEASRTAAYAAFAAARERKAMNEQGGRR
jgi:hypothetical protein